MRMKSYLPAILQLMPCPVSSEAEWRISRPMLCTSLMIHGYPLPVVTL